MYKEAYSKELEIPVFYNDFGLFLITYDSESFVMVKLSNKEDVDFTNFSFSNFYSKSEVKVNAMTQQKVKDYILSL